MHPFQSFPFSEIPSVRLTDVQRDAVEVMYRAGLFRKVLACCKATPDEDLEGQVNLWACQLVAKHFHRGDIRGLLFVSLCRLVNRHRKQRNARVAREQAYAAQLPQSYYAPDLSSFWDDPAAMRILATATVTNPSNLSRKSFAVRQARLARLRKEHAPNAASA